MIALAQRRKLRRQHSELGAHLDPPLSRLLCFEAWSNFCALGKLSKALAQLKKEQDQQIQEALCSELQQALDEGNAAAVWTLAKAIGGKSGPKLRSQLCKRVFQVSDWEEGVVKSWGGWWLSCSTNKLARTPGDA